MHAVQALFWLGCTMGSGQSTAVRADANPRGAQTPCPPLTTPLAATIIVSRISNTCVASVSASDKLVIDLTAVACFLGYCYKYFQSLNRCTTESAFPLYAIAQNNKASYGKNRC